MDNHQLIQNIETQSLYQPELILALDYGVKKMGVAMGNTVSGNARPFDIMSMDNGQPNWESLLELIYQWKINRIIIGLPLNMDGTSSQLSKRAHKFARRLAHKLMEQKHSAHVLLYDERLSSVEAREIAWENGWIQDERDEIDDVSACLLLGSYLKAPSNAKDVTAFRPQR